MKVYVGKRLPATLRNVQFVNILYKDDVFSKNRENSTDFHNIPLFVRHFVSCMLL